MKKVLLSALIVAAQAGMIFTTQAEQSPQTVNIGFQKANIFALLKYRGTLDESFKKTGDRGALGRSSPPGRRCWKD